MGTYKLKTLFWKTNQIAKRIVKKKKKVQQKNPTTIP